MRILESVFFGEVAQDVETTMRLKDDSLLAGKTHNPVGKPSQQIAALRARRIGGLFLIQNEVKDK